MKEHWLSGRILKIFSHVGTVCQVLLGLRGCLGAGTGGVQNKYDMFFNLEEL